MESRGKGAGGGARVSSSSHTNTTVTVLEGILSPLSVASKECCRQKPDAISYHVFQERDKEPSAGEFGAIPGGS